MASSDIRVAATTDPTRLASSIMFRLKEEGRADLVAVGARSVNQAEKGIAIAEYFASQEGKAIIERPRFGEFVQPSDGQEKSCLIFRLDLVTSSDLDSFLESQNGVAASAEAGHEFE